jgi:hypothetical protein
LEEDNGFTILLAWQNSHSQINSSIAISNNQVLTTKDIISDKLVSIRCLVKESSATNAVNGNMDVDDTSGLKTSTRIKKAPVTKDFL